MKWASSRGGREGAIKDPPFPQVWWVGKRGRRSEGAREAGWREKKPNIQFLGIGEKLERLFLSLVTPSMAPLPFIDFFGKKPFCRIAQK